jgi:polysaccharide biosynthesis/export protein
MAFLMGGMLLMLAQETPGDAAEPGIDFSDIPVERKIEPSDILYIEVFNEQNLTVERRVQADGTISFPLLRTVEVGGKTPSEIAQLLTRKLEEDYLVHPEVTVMIKEYRSSTVSVMGKVNKPGPVQLPPEHRMDILEAIALAGDLQRGANSNRIEHTRNGKSTNYRFDDLKRNPSKRVWLEPGDIIFVHERFF